MRIAAALLALTMLFGALAPSAHAYGAMAVGRAQDGSLGVSILTRPSEPRVNSDAMMVCERIVRRRGAAPREQCRLVRTFTNLCAAAVHDQRNRFFYGFATENYWARVRAQDACRRAQGRNCSVIRSLCDTTRDQPRQSREAGQLLTNPN